MTVPYSGVRAETSTRVAGGPRGFDSEGVRGLKALGVRELSYRLAFLACNVAPTNPRVRETHIQANNKCISIDIKLFSPKPKKQIRLQTWMVFC